MTERRGGADLHLHTVFSDGAYTPERLVAAAVEREFRYIGITDHDTADGIIPTRDAAAGTGLEIIAGIEFGTATDDAMAEELHVVGLFLDTGCAELQERLVRLREQRRTRAMETIEKLNRMGIELRPQDVFDSAGGVSVGRPHIARALVKAGRVRNVSAAFKRWLGRNGPAFVPRERAPVAEVIALIHRARGVAVLAHPGQTRRDDDIPKLAAAGLDGIEVYCPDHSPSDEKRYLEFCRAHSLLPGGGSDCHGEEGGRIAFGRVRVYDELVEALRRRAAQQTSPL